MTYIFILPVYPPFPESSRINTVNTTYRSQPIISPTLKSQQVNLLRRLRDDDTAITAYRQSEELLASLRHFHFASTAQHQTKEGKIERSVEANGKNALVPYQQR